MQASTDHKAFTVVLSRVDAIGDVILTLPLCGLIREKYPRAKIIFIGRTYTQAVISCCEHVDEFINADNLLKMKDADAAAELKKLNADYFIHVFPNRKLSALAKKAEIPNRIGTTNRLFHWGKVNKLVRLSRKNSTLHEAQLNCMLLKPLGITDIPGLKTIGSYVGFTKIPVLKEEAKTLSDTTKINVILHPKSNASAREWSLENYSSLIKLLPAKDYKIFISGTDKEKELLSGWIKTLPPHVTDITGKFSLNDFIAFISHADFLVAASTGPLHIASACGIGAIGIYPPIRPMHPGRWQPIGKNATYLCIKKDCSDCRKNPQSCSCINDVTAIQVASLLKKH